MAVNPDKNIVEQSLIARLIGKIKRIALDISDDVSAEETRAMAAEAAAKTVVAAGENCSVTKTTASDGHDVYIINADGKPQVQADWNQSDSTKVDYIKNKLNLSNAIDSTSTTEAATPKAVKDAYDELNNKIVARAVFLSQAEWAVQSQLPGDPAKVYYVENGTGEDAYTVYVWNSSTSAYVEVDESSIDLDGYWHDGPSSSGTGNVVTGMSLGNDGVPVLEKNLTAATLDSNGTVPVSQIPDSVKDKIVFIDGTITNSGGSYRVSCNTTYAQVAAIVNPSVGKYPICRFTLGSQIYYFAFHLGVPTSSSSPRYTFGSTDVYSGSGTVSFMTSVYVEPDDVWEFREIKYDPTSWTNALSGKVDKESGKGLSTNDFTNAYKNAVDANTSARHTHSNKSVLDGISSTDVTNWNGKVSGPLDQSVTGASTSTTTAPSTKAVYDYAPPKNHASTGTEFGAADATHYGHTKLTSAVAVNSTSEALAVTPKGVYNFAVPVSSIDLSNTTTDLVTEIKNRVGTGVGYLRFVCKGDGASANIANRPISQNNSFYCEVSQVRYQSATDYRYRLRFESTTYGAYAADLIPSYTTLTWYRMIKQYNHQSTTAEYGAADATHYGHTMLSTSITTDSASNAKAATPKAVADWTGGYKISVNPGGTPGSAANTLYFC